MTNKIIVLARVTQIWTPSMGLVVVQPRHKNGVLLGSLLPAEVMVLEHLVKGSVASKDPQGFQHTLAVSLACVLLEVLWGSSSIGYTKVGHAGVQTLYVPCLGK